MAAQAMPDGCILAFDFGKRRIGVAVGQALTRTASPLETVVHGDQPDWDSISRLVKEWKPGAFVVGLPLSLDGEETPTSALAREFGKKLGEKHNTEVYFQDERLTSVDAERRFVEMRAAGTARRKDSARLDAVAAKIILENWLNTAS